MSESAEALAANQESRRNVTIEITNVSTNYCLVDPRVFLHSGNTHSPPQPVVCPGRVEVCNFSKSSGQATGAVGILMYDLLHRDGSTATESLAIMFSVPHNYSLYKNWVGLGITASTKECNEAMFDEMYDKEGTWFVRQKASGCCLLLEGSSLDIMCTMSPLGRAIMKVEVWDKIFSPPTNQCSF